MTHLGCLQQVFGFNCCSSLQDVFESQDLQPCWPWTPSSAPSHQPQLACLPLLTTDALQGSRDSSTCTCNVSQLTSNRSTRAAENQRWAQCTVNDLAYVNAGQQGQAACMPTRCQPCVFVFTQLTNESLARILQGSLVFTCCLISLITGSPTSLQASRYRYGSAAPSSTPRLEKQLTTARGTVLSWSS